MQRVDVRPVDPRDDPRVGDVVRAAFGSDIEYGLIEDLRSDVSWVPALSLGAYVGDELVGHVLFTEARAGTLPAVLLAPLAVLPEWQRRGVGSALARTGLDVSREMGFAVALVLGHPAYYPRFGFEPAIPHGVRPPYPVDPAEAWMVAELVPGSLPSAAGVPSLGAPFMDPAMWRE